MPRQKKTTKEKPNLSGKELSFCYEYIANGFNGTRAYMAIYGKGNENVAAVLANKLLRKVKIKGKVAELTKKYLQPFAITGNKVLKEIAKNGFSNITDFVSWNAKDGVIIKDSAELGEYASAIREIDIDAVEVKDMDGCPTGIKNYRIKCKLHDKNKALEMLGKNLMLFEDKKLNEDKDVHVTVTYND